MFWVLTLIMGVVISKNADNIRSSNKIFLIQIIRNRHAQILTNDLFRSGP